ncbi:cytochrome c [Shewanella sp. NIFS-20-20]|uniref:c-type cytochrome n=1 Tax=Shewanella sp. NIFS-20-20 TaxID=2853806 RepID=UPI001C444384|nr:cytochrome c [Shewanella sp. NIFS-20-20]MBV7315083.1 cytochrome c [Shewanella sp. NIFS-20-20]
MKMKILSLTLLMLPLSVAADGVSDHDRYNQALAKLNAQIPPALVEHQADAERGGTLAMQRCIACHGEGMLKMMKTYPSLNGQKSAFMVKQLLEFKSGQRVNPIMQAQAMSLSDADIKDIALWYSQQPLMNLAQ